jgi:hypothetical protein
MQMARHPGPYLAPPRTERLCPLFDMQGRPEHDFRNSYE